MFQSHNLYSWPTTGFSVDPAPQSRSTSVLPHTLNRSLLPAVRDHENIDRAGIATEIEGWIDTCQLQNPQFSYRGIESCPFLLLALFAFA